MKKIKTFKKKKHYTHRARTHEKNENTIRRNGIIMI